MKKYTDKELLYAATVRCKCGAGLAYPLHHNKSWKLNAWICSVVLRGEAEVTDHDHYPWAFYKIREETSINNRGGFTTRPAGTKALTKGEATCKKCGTWWEGEPYNACGLKTHWHSDCPTCGEVARFENGASNMNIEHRFKDVVVDA
jgi:hypothetical protein